MENLKEKIKEIINRKVYKEIKRMDRTQMETFFTKLYLEGFAAGAEGIAEDEREDEILLTVLKGEEKAELTPIIHLIDDMYCGDIKGVGMAITNKVQAHARAKGYLDI